jgi:hypothetical protein
MEMFAWINSIVQNDKRVIAAGDAALGLWVRALSWSAGHTRDGRIPREVVAQLDDSGAHAASLVRVGLWVETKEGFAFVPSDLWQISPNNPDDCDEP